ncbi:ABC transporter permease [Butyricicoccus faecihominis]|uniref:ABC transporter permease n=1 Tax=Butyricicoccus faecihominis TaxID=1712515 RepID=UPI0024798587|nr:ABC transporter permease [Butyricicoccus faecihominis]MCQ5128263.1 ABC transporter permease [Butyricicoccus faecihominis]
MKDERHTSFRINLILYLKDQAIPMIVLLLMVVIASMLSPVFLSKANAQNLVVQIAMNMVVSMGMFIVILTGGIDLSVGSIVALCGVLVAGFMRSLPIGIAILLAMLVGTLIGAFNGLIVSRMRIAPFIVTLGMLSFARGIAYWYTNSTPIIWSSLPGADFMSWLGGAKLLGVPILALIWLLMIILTFLLLRYTIAGRIIYAIGGNEEAVKLSGVDLCRWKMIPYLLSGLCCAIGGILLTARLGVGAPTSGDGLELDCIAAVVIGGASFNGGIGNVGGTVIGVFILGIINNILDLMNVPQYPQMMLKGTIIVAAVILSTIREKRK